MENGAAHGRERRGKAKDGADWDWMHGSGEWAAVVVGGGCRRLWVVAKVVVVVGGLSFSSALRLSHSLSVSGGRADVWA